MKKISMLMPDLRGGGAERVAVNLANEFVRRGYTVDMLLMSATGEFLNNLPPAVRVVDFRVKRLRSVLLPLIRYLRQTHPDALLASMWPLTVITLWARRIARVRTRVVVAEHTTWSKAEITRSLFTRWHARTTMHLTFPSSDGVVAVSDGAADDLARFAHIDRAVITVIYNPIVGEPLPSSEKQLELADWWTGSHRRILAVGTLKPVKGYATLLTAFAQLRQQVDVRLLILGEGECRAALEAQARQLGIKDSVFLPGFVKDPSPYYTRADLHVLSSTAEGFGNVIVEALAAGTPVVSTDCLSGPREILCDGKYGNLVPVGDAAGLATAMATSLAATHDTEALKARARDFSIDKAVDRYLELLVPDETAHAS